ncbi:MAG: hypothetical protein WCL08_00330 [Verrucomicrobiota bacterium]
MSLTVRAAYDDLASYLEAAQRTIPVGAESDDPRPAILTAIHSALEELAAIGPVYQFRARRGAHIYAPTALTIATLAAGSTFTNALPTWMVGCSILITGDTQWNRIVDLNGTTVTLLNPTTASGSNVAATVYCDSISLAADVIQLMRPVTLADKYDLAPVHSVSDIQYARYDGWNNADSGAFVTDTAEARKTAVPGAPAFYFVDTHYLAGYVEPSRRVMLGPMPREVGTLNYSARVSPPKFTNADIYGASPYTDPATAIPVPASIAESIFLPIARQRFMGSAIFRNDKCIPEINRQFKVAYEILREMHPQANIGIPQAPAATAPQPQAQ